MKTIAKSILLIMLILSLSMAVISCSEEAEKKVAPFEFEYTLHTEKDDDGEITEEYYTVKSFAISAEAKEFLDDDDMESLVELFNTEVKDGDKVVYAKPETLFTEDTIRKLEIPTTYKEKNVTGIESEAFIEQSLFTEIVVGDHITEIGEGAFSGVSNLESIELEFVGESLNAVNQKKLFGYIFGTIASSGSTLTTQNYNEGEGATATYHIPSSLTKVKVNGANTKTEETIYWNIVTNEDGEEVYEFVESTDEYDFTQTITKKEYAVDAYAFYGCTTLKEVVLSSAIEDNLDENTFNGCNSLTTMELPLTVKTLPNYVFANCTSLKTIDLALVETIGEFAFSGCTALGTVGLTSNPVEIYATVVGESAFAGCTNLYEVVFVETVEIEKNAFTGLTNLVKIDFRSAGNTIGNNAFKGATRIKEITLNNVISLGNSAFNGASNLKTVNFTDGQSITIGDYAFYNCEELKELDLSGINATYKSDDKIVNGDTVVIECIN